MCKNSSNTKNLQPIYVVTPTYTRPTQKSDLLSVCYTIMHVQNIVWIVIEDSSERTEVVSQVLEHCKVDSIHMVVKTSQKYRRSWPLSMLLPTLKGVDQRNAALEWLREKYTIHNASGIVYFADDDNKYDIRLFEEVSEG